MKTELLNNFLRGDTRLTIVTKDNEEVNTDNIFKTLNKVTNNNWSYVVDSLKCTDGYMTAIITLFAPGRVMQGVASSTDIDAQRAIKEAIVMAYCSLITDCNGNDNLLVGKSTSENKVLTTIEEIEKEQTTLGNVTTDNDNVESNGNKTVINEEQLDDTKPVVKGSEVTEKQIFFMNKFKEHNKITNDSQFDYYIKTWAENCGFDDINTKSALVYSNYQTIQNFIDWIKKMQPALDNGLTSPIE